MSSSVPNPPTASRWVTVKAKVLTASKALLRLPTRLIMSLTSSPLLSLAWLRPRQPPCCHTHTHTHTHTRTRAPWPLRWLFPLPGTLLSRSPHSRPLLRYHLLSEAHANHSISNCTPLLQLSQFPSSSSICPQDSLLLTRPRLLYVHCLALLIRFDKGLAHALPHP